MGYLITILYLLSLPKRYNTAKSIIDYGVYLIELIINADDFGYSKIFNERILELLEKGALKSTTVLIPMIDKNQDEQIKRLIELHKRKGIGIGIEFVFEKEENAVKVIEEQCDRFAKMFGFFPSHLDLHLSKSLRERQDYPQLIAKLANLVADLAEDLKIPMPNDVVFKIDGRESLKKTTQDSWMITYHSFDEIAKFVDGLKEGQSYVFHSHPGEYDPNSTSSLNSERKNDYENVLKLQSYLSARGDIKVVSFLDLGRSKIKKVN